MKRGKTLLTILGFALLTVGLVRLPAQESFGFEDAGVAAVPPPGPAAAASLSGEFRAGARVFADDLDEPASIVLGDIASTVLTVRASGSSVEGEARFRLSRAVLTETPERAIDELFLRLYAGPAVVETGIMKLSWGKADSLGPLDVTNPLDLSDLSITDELERKIARPMLHVSIGVGRFATIESVLLPGFQGHRIATEGPWVPASVAALDARLAARAAGASPTYADLEADYSGLGDSQVGARFTTTSGSIDWGIQYFYGRLPLPTVRYVPPADLSLVHERFHQGGVDFAAVIATFNLRAEVAGNFTEDLAGDDPGIRNPYVPFSLGFDRDLAAGLGINLQYSGSYRLGDGEIDSPYDVENDSPAFSSRLTVVLSQSLLKDSLEWKVTTLWNIQDADWLVRPSLAYRMGDAELELAAGLFGGDSEGDFGQYRDETYFQARVKYAF